MATHSVLEKLKNENANTNELIAASAKYLDDFVGELNGAQAIKTGQILSGSLLGMLDAGSAVMTLARGIRVTHGGAFALAVGRSSMSLSTGVLSIEIAAGTVAQVLANGTIVMMSVNKLTPDEQRKFRENYDVIFGKSETPAPQSTFKNLFPNEATPPHPKLVSRPSALLKERGAKVYDYVVKENGELVLGEYSSGAGHANLAQGQPVRAAGQVRVSGGQIIEIDNASGHYLPKGTNARNAALDAFRENGFQVPGQTYVEKFFNEATKLWEAVK